MPETNQVHVDAALTQVSVAYRNADFIADAVAPVVPVRKQSDKYFVVDPTREALRPTDDARAPGAEAAETGFAVSTDSYFCDDHALAAAIPDEERDNADPAIQPDIDRTEFLTDKILLNREVALEALLRTSADVPGEDLDPASRWDDPDNDPVAALRPVREAVFGRVQRRPNTLILPYAVFDAVRNHPRVVERVKYTALGVVSGDLLAQLFDVDRVLVPRACRNGAPRGQDPNVAPVWGNNAYLLHVPPRPGLRQVAAAYTFAWTAAPGGTGGFAVERWREARRKADMVRVQFYYDQKLVAPGAAYRLGGVIS